MTDGEEPSSGPASGAEVLLSDSDSSVLDSSGPSDELGCSVDGVMLCSDSSVLEGPCSVDSSPPSGDCVALGSSGSGGVGEMLETSVSG